VAVGGAVGEGVVVVVVVVVGGVGTPEQTMIASERVLGRGIYLGLGPSLS
jgi:hypothetical protein